MWYYSSVALVSAAHALPLESLHLHPTCDRMSTAKPESCCCCSCGATATPLSPHRPQSEVQQGVTHACLALFFWSCLMCGWYYVQMSAFVRLCTHKKVHRKIRIYILTMDSVIANMEPIYSNHIQFNLVIQYKLYIFRFTIPFYHWFLLYLIFLRVFSVIYVRGLNGDWYLNLRHIFHSI